MMKRWIIGQFLFLLVAFSPTVAQAGEIVDYVLGPTDVVSINVLGFPDLTVTEVMVRPDGKIAMNPIGDVTASGLSPVQLAEAITERLSYYYEAPVVTVSVSQFRTTRVYVVGQVTRPGWYELDKRHNLMDAIGAAQGWTQDALKTKVHLIRNNSKDRPTMINLMDLLKKGDYSKNVILEEGDIVFLTGNNRIDFVRDVLPTINPGWILRHWNDPP